MSENTINLASGKECCGCGACVSVCPRHAIRMEIRDDGASYPMIDQALCVHCGLCQKVCSYQIPSVEVADSPVCYAAASKRSDIRALSSSGGVFASIAERVIDHGGVIYGCALEPVEGHLTARHIRVDEKKDLTRIQGTKYVQSKLDGVFQMVSKDLAEGREVLFSGTPCQVAGVKSALMKVNCDRLMTVDILCHGVPGEAIFEKYIQFTEQRLKGSVVNVVFRNKKYGWGARGSIVYTKNGVTKEKQMTPHDSSYYRLFLDSEIFRDSCYTCKYACSLRVGDITLGDFWGIEAEHPELLTTHGGKIQKEQGVSSVLINTNKGKELLDACADCLEIYPSSLEHITKRNSCLLYPSRGGKNREYVRKLLNEQGYSAVNTWSNRKQGIKRYLFILKSKLRG